MEDITGQKFNKLTAIKYSHKSKSKDIYWVFKCDCGTIKTIIKGQVKSGVTKSCGCYSKLKNCITGKRYGRLVVLGFSNIKKGRAYWSFKCDCGKVKDIMATTVVCGHVVSCGCYNKEVLLAANTTHNKCRTKVYSSWINMKNRCYYKDDTNYKNYGGRGIKVCDKWVNSFEDFFNDMGDKPFKNASLDRIDNDGNYEPSNCRWANMKQQARNTRRNVLLEYCGEIKCLTDWAEIYNISRSTLQRRLDLGWSIKEALTKPICIKFRNGLTIKRNDI